MCSTRPGLSQYEQIRLDNIRQRDEMFRTLDFNQVTGAGLDKSRSEKIPNSLFHPSCWWVKSVFGFLGLYSAILIVYHESARTKRFGNNTAY